MTRAVSVQAARVGLEAIEEGVVRLAGGECRAVLEVGSVDFGLRGEVEREALVAGFGAFVRGLARRRTLLERRFYVVVPADLPARPASSWLRRLWPFGRAADPAPDAAAAGRQLALRCAEVARQLGRCGLGARRLESADLARLYHACWCPELARVQRIRRALDEYTALVVSAPRAGKAVA